MNTGTCSLIKQLSFILFFIINMLVVSWAITGNGVTPPTVLPRMISATMGSNNCQWYLLNPKGNGWTVTCPNGTYLQEVQPVIAGTIQGTSVYNTTGVTCCPVVTQWQPALPFSSENHSITIVAMVLDPLT